MLQGKMDLAARAHTAPPEQLWLSIHTGAIAAGE